MNTLNNEMKMLLNDISKKKYNKDTSDFLLNSDNIEEREYKRNILNNVKVEEIAIGILSTKLKKEDLSNSQIINIIGYFLDSFKAALDYAADKYLGKENYTGGLLNSFSEYLYKNFIKEFNNSIEL